jgi:phenylacetate-coenzyme A ligase PaaK-like adenylate-forming protein
MTSTFESNIWKRADTLFGRSKNQWSSIDYMIYDSEDYFTLSPQEAEQKRFAAIKESITHHYKNSRFYHQLCNEYDFSPEHINSTDDFHLVPMVPDTFFKEYPNEHPKAVFEWLQKISTVDIGEYTYRGRNLQGFLRWTENRLEGLVNHSSGTTGNYSLMFRDKVTYQRFYYAAVRSLLKIPPTIEDNPHYVYPGSPNTFLTIGRWLSEGAKVFSKNHRHFLTEREISMTIARLISTGYAKNLKEKLILRKLKKAMIKGEKKLLELLQKLDNKNEQAIIISPPFQLFSMMMIMKKEHIQLDLGESNSVVFTGGGWKIFEDKKVPLNEFATLVEETLGIPRSSYVDVYGMSEMNGLAISCEAGYKHLHPWIHPMVLDDHKGNLGFGNYGRFAFLDPIAHSYPGYIMTGDKVKLLKRCPVCEKTGYVLEPDISRMGGAEAKGCANLMRGMMAEELRKVEGERLNG